MIYIFNRDEEQISSLDLEPKITVEIGKLSILEFASEIEFEKGFRVLYIDSNKKTLEFIITEIDYSREEDVNHFYLCQDALVELNTSIIMDKRPEGNFQKVIGEILQGTRWILEVLPTFSQDKTLKNSYFRIPTFEALTQAFNNYDLEWSTRYEGNTRITKRVLVIGKIGKKSHGTLEFGKNILKFERKILPGPIITALYGYGKGEQLEGGSYGRRIDFADINNGKPYVENIVALHKYGLGPKESKFHNFGVMIYEDIEDKALLLQATQKDLSILSQVQAEYTVSAVDIGIDVYIGDEIPVIDEKIDFRGYTRVIKTVRIADELELTFGTAQKSFTGSIEKLVKNETKLVKDELQSVINNILASIAEQYFGEDGYNYDLKKGNSYDLPAGLYSFDKAIEENPTKVVYLGAGKVLIANERGTDGAWIWKTAMTGEGVVGDSIITNSITANQLASDIGQSLDLSSNVAIQALVTNESYNADKMTLEQRLTEILQTSSNFEISFIELINQVDENKIVTDAEFEYIKSYFNFSEDGLDIGKSGNQLKLRLTNNRVAFFDGENEVAYISNNTLEIYDGNFLNSLGIGNFEFIPRESGNLSFRKKRG